MGKNKNKNKLPMISICTPTFNRRPFIPMIIKCFENQDYPKENMEWLIIDDGTDKVEDLFINIPQVKYIRYEQKLTLGKKRNLLNDMAKGEILIYMDDDDYYPPDRISHAVDKLLKNPNVLCAGSSEMYIYFKHIKKMYKFGPYGPNHSTAATFAFRKDLLKLTKFDETSCVAEEKHFLHNYTIPIVQLDSLKSILVFSHNHNSFDKKELLQQIPNPYTTESSLKPEDFIKEKEILKFFMEDINNLLDEYSPGKPENKPDVSKQLVEIKEKREKSMKDQMNQMLFQQNQKNLMNNPSLLEQIQKNQQLIQENKQLKDKVEYLDNKIKQLIQDRIKEKLSIKESL